ncbi:MAG: hypothetical protein WC365_07110 [Candidatus Babeliales bacterium]|jgi:hypothetical protein
MKSRCYNAKIAAYQNYGGRGIKLCDEWKESFNSFFKWAMGAGYADNLTVERKNVNGNYDPNNCKWSTKHEQSINKTNSVYVDYGGKKVTISEVAVILNVSPYTLYSRLKKLHWSMEDTLAITPSYSNDRRFIVK